MWRINALTWILGPIQPLKKNVLSAWEDTELPEILARILLRAMRNLVVTMSGKAGKDIHIPVLNGMLSEAYVDDLLAREKGRLVFSKLKYFDAEIYGVFYIDHEHGPYEVIPLRSLGFKNLTSLGRVEQFWNSKNLSGMPELMTIEDLKSIPTTPIPPEA